jgi:CheY-like chemotaxis protein
MIERIRPCLVFLDIGMPQMNGYEVARRVRSQPRLSSTRLVAITGWSQEEQRVRAREAGFDEHMVKPADVGALRTLLDSLEPPVSLE